jgi:NRPS condensation-like uncharacterized protein
MIETLIDKLANLGISIGLHQLHQLRINTAIQNVPPDLLSMIKEHKEEIVMYLQANSIMPMHSSMPSVKSQESYPLSSSQKRIWAFCKQVEGSMACNMPKVQTLDFDINLTSLRYAVNCMIERHEILRTVFCEDEKGLVMQYVKPYEANKVIIDCRDISDVVDITQPMKVLTSEVISEAFDLAQGPLLRMCVCKIGSASWVVVLVIHHIISDGWSMNVFVNELLLFYNAHTTGSEAGLQPLRIQYKDYAVWQQTQLETPEMQLSKSYWLGKFQGSIPVINLHNPKVNSNENSNRGSVLARHITPVLADGLVALNNSQGCTMFMGLLAMLNVLLYKRTAHTDIVIVSPVAGRDNADLENQIGYYVNMLALRTTVNGGESFKQLMKQVKHTTVEAYAHQLYPFDSLVNEVNSLHDTNSNPLFNVQLSLQSIEKQTQINHVQPSKGAATIKSNIENWRVIYNLVFHFAEAEDNLLLTIVYNRDLYDEPQIEMLLNDFEQLLHTVLQEPDKALQDII